MTPPKGPKATIDIKSIRNDPSKYQKNCLARNYKAQARYPARISELYKQWHQSQFEAGDMRTRNNHLQQQLKAPLAVRKGDFEDAQGIKETDREQLIEQARLIKEKLSIVKAEEDALMSEIVSMAAAIPNLTSDKTPIGDTPEVVGFINGHYLFPDPKSSKVPSRRSHTDIGKECDIFDFAAGARTSGWGWYFLLNEAAQLEQALIQYALKVAMDHGWGMVSPPSMVYSHIANACGFQPRDQNGESQIYGIQQSPDDVGRKPELSLAGTAEIPLAGMKANVTMEQSELPIKRVGVSRSYRAEAGARGVDTKGLYRVHEFTKVEMFAWTLPTDEASTGVFDEMLSIQTTILGSLNLHCRILEMPSQDLGASATRKRDIEAFFPSRRDKDEGYGEVTSVSTCTDYQSRRLATRIRTRDGQLSFPYTVNGTAMAVPRVLACIIENGWDQHKGEVAIPEVLWPWMDGLKAIRSKERFPASDRQKPKPSKEPPEPLYDFNGKMWDPCKERWAEV